MYLAIAKSLPRLYLDAPRHFPAPVIAEYFTGWFPLYLLLIRAAAAVAGDARVAALALSTGFSALAVLLARRLAARTGGRPERAAALFILWPPMCLVTGSLACVEPLFVCCALAAVLAVLEDRPWTAAAACAAGAVAQKSGFLLPPLALLLAWRRGGAVGLRRYAPCLASYVPLALLQGWLWAAFGDPLLNVRVQRDIFGGALFGWPFAALLKGAFSPSPFGPARSALILLAAAGYLAVLAAAWRRGRQEEEPLRWWLGSVLAFHLCLDGFWAFHSLPRMLLLGAPPAVLLAEPLVPRGRALLWMSPLLVLAPYLLGLLEFGQAESFLRRAWGPGHYAAASRSLR